MALSSLVETTATVLAMHAGPIVSSRNSRTSRPRSPTSATTTVSKALAAASMASSVDLPTPEPAKMPRRWPKQIGVKMSMTLTPVAKAEPTRWRASAGGCATTRGVGGIALRQRRAAVDRAGERVDGAAAPGGVRQDGERAEVEDGVADAGVACALERRDQHLVGRNLHDLAMAQAGAAAMLDHVAEPRDLRQAAHAEMGRRDFGDATAAAHKCVLVGEAPPGPLQRLERVVLRREQRSARSAGTASSTARYFEPSVLIASS